MERVRLGLGEEWKLAWEGAATFSAPCDLSNMAVVLKLS